MANGVIQLELKDEFGATKDLRAGLSNIDLETTDLDLGVPGKEKYIDVLLPLMAEDSNFAGVSLTVGTKDHIGDAIVWGLPETLEAGMQPIYVRLTARYFRLRLQGATNSAFFVWSAIDFYGSVDGDRF